MLLEPLTASYAARLPRQLVSRAAILNASFQDKIRSIIRRHSDDAFLLGLKQPDELHTVASASNGVGRRLSKETIQQPWSRKSSISRWEDAEAGKEEGFERIMCCFVGEKGENLSAALDVHSPPPNTIERYSDGQQIAELLLLNMASISCERLESRLPTTTDEIIQH